MLVCPLDFRYGRDEVKKIFSEESRLQKQLEVEGALANAQSELGIIPKSAAKKIQKVIKSGVVKPERVKELERATKHDIMAVVHALAEKSGDAGKYIHLGATSYDIVDTANALQFREILQILDEDLQNLQKVLVDLAHKHKKTLMAGRTHGQYAVPMTFGLKIAVYAMEVNRHLERLRECKVRLCVGKMSGAVGTGAAHGKDSLKIQTSVMKSLGLGTELAASQIVIRDRYVEFIQLLANIATSLEKFATEIRNLQRSELNEVAESFDVKNQVGSSTMAQKRNPITSENVSGLARLVRSMVIPTYENAIQWHERDLANSASERFIIPHACILTDDIIIKMTDVFSNLDVHEYKMAANLAAAGDKIMAESVIMKLVEKGMSRQEAHEILRQGSLKADSQGRTLGEILLKTKKVTKLLTDSEIESALDPTKYIGHSEKIVEKVKRSLS
ncbi:MAG: adenylosuccinate lyase [Thermoplasmata archaeon]|nr:MAG: adenylosuccinate lyase [Thermoplasmata archaeon]